MTRVSDLCLRRTTVAIVFLCMMALTLCQILGPTARLNHDFSPADLPGQAFAAVTVPANGVHVPVPSRCASIKLAPIEIRVTDFEQIGEACAPSIALTSIPPLSAELGVPTPPPRAA